MTGNNWSRYGRNIYLLKRIRAVSAVFISVTVIIVAIFLVSRLRDGVSNERRELLRVWNEGNFEQAYLISKNALLEDPVNYFMLTVNGFSAYQLGVSQINNQNTLKFIDECIFSLRKALLHNKRDASVYYVLGKAYRYKGAEYAELAVKYLEKANSLSYDAADIPEHLGLAYAAFGDYRRSVEAFSKSFIPGQNPSDSLLLSIARSYMAMEEYNMAISYLLRCVETSPDSNTVVIARFMLAEIYRVFNDFENAQNQYLSILNETGENAEAHFQLGELYNLQGDTTRARSQWRTAHRQDPLHARARARLNI